MAGDRTMNDDLDEPQFEHEEPAAQHKKRTKKKRPRDNDDDDDATPGAPPILEESAAAAAEPASTAPVTFQTAGGPAKKPRPPGAAPRDGAAWAAWLRNLLPDADAAALPARCAPPEGDVKMAVAARVRRGQKQGRAVDVVVVCTSARRAADLARTLRDHAKIRRVFKLFGKHKDRKEQERALATLSPLPRVAVATGAAIDPLVTENYCLRPDLRRRRAGAVAGGWDGTGRLKFDFRTGRDARAPRRAPRPRALGARRRAARRRRARRQGVHALHAARREGSARGHRGRVAGGHGRGLWGRRVVNYGWRDLTQGPRPTARPRAQSPG